MTTRVLIAGGGAEVRTSIRQALEAADGIEPAGEAETLALAILEAGRGKFDVLLLDQDGLVLLPTLLGESPASKVVVLGTEDDPGSARAAFAAGASGYLLDDAPGSELVAAVHEVATGGRYVNPELGARLFAAESETRRLEDDPLSEREREVLRLLALGHTNQEIATQLVISVRTAEAHRAHVMKKLGLSSRAELVRYALDRGLLAQ